jgi:hypothetical protein
MQSVGYEKQQLHNCRQELRKEGLQDEVVEQAKILYFYDRKLIRNGLVFLK